MYEVKQLLGQLAEFNSVMYKALSGALEADNILLVSCPYEGFAYVQVIQTLTLSCCCGQR